MIKKKNQPTKQTYDALIFYYFKDFIGVQIKCFFYLYLSLAISSFLCIISPSLFD